ncbi:RHS repeat domain-containing protein [Fontivita pretiosa]|uniref:RHS repeat domain-containing protein n=1 Tax=Fontivita pretiosa TaxID=2989684 RepID=UPI003D1663AE
MGGNWTSFKEDFEGNGTFTDSTDLTQTRSHNKANEITGITGEQPGQVAWATPAYDAMGNVTSYPKPGSMTSSYTCKSDAWNRLTEVKDGANVVAAYAYDGLGRRITRKTYDSGGSLTETRQFFYSNRWQIIEERVEGRSNPQERQYVWGTQYVDELILRDRDANGGSSGDGVLEQRHYALQDANYSVTCIVDSSGDAAERYVYTPYGTRDIRSADFSSSLSTSAVRWNIGHQGLMHDTNTSLVYNRARMLHPGLGRFMQRDPLAYVDGSNLYHYVRSNPLDNVDGDGLKCRVATKCDVIRLETDILGFLTQGSSGILHCGIVISDDEGVLVVDAGPNDSGENVFEGAPAQNEEAWGHVGPYADRPDEDCACLRSQWKEWNTHKFKYEAASRNSNYAVKCLMKKCGMGIKWKGLVKPWGYKSRCDKDNECPPNFIPPPKPATAPTGPGGFGRTIWRVS